MNKKLLFLAVLAGILIYAGRLYALQQLYTGQAWAPPASFKGEVKPWTPPNFPSPLKPWAPPAAFKGELKPWNPPKTFQGQVGVWQPPKGYKSEPPQTGPKRFEKGKPSLPENTLTNPAPGKPLGPTAGPGAAPLPYPIPPMPEQETGGSTTYPPTGP